MKTTVAECAKLVRKEVKAKYPNSKVSVTSENYSMGDSVNVRVEGLSGELSNELRAELRAKYQYGHFNGMEDIYENSNNRDDTPQTKFLFVN